MIGSLRGMLVDRDDAEVTIDVGGVGYRVTVSPTTAVALGDPGDEVSCWVHHHQREDAQTLYGFATKDERRCFEALLGAHGVGPALALGILSVHAPGALARILAEDWGVKSDLWSVTSWNELARDGAAAEQWNLLHPGEEARTAYVTDKLAGAPGPVVAVSDYMRAVPLQIARWVPQDYRVLGADGFGFADTRPAARRFFQIDAESVVVQVLQALADAGEIDRSKVAEAFASYRIDDPTAVRGVKQEGGDA